MGSGIRSTCKFVKSMSKINSKVYDPKTYNKEFDNLIHRKTWRLIINKKL